MHLPELLSPAGGMDHLKAAVENGADAVYMGGCLFNARQNAENFDEDGMRRAIEYAHVRGVNVYIAMNTLIADGEMHSALDAAGQAWLAGADALIVQDLGFASLLRQSLSDLPLHISTQGTVYSAEGIRALAPLGFSRAILARELTLEEIGRTAAQSPIPVEVFAHGALCVCHSGQCLMSSLIGARSGNRGLCAQPCRLPYRLGEQAGYLLSPRDLCTLELLPELLATGAAALKIEGRMKSPEYVAVVTAAYRKHLDRCAEGGPWRVDEADMRDLLQVFNRGGFTTGYLKGRPNRALACPERPKHWGVPVGTVIAHNRASGVVEVWLTGTVRLGDGVEIVNDTLPGNIITSLKVNGAGAREAGPGRASLGTIHGSMRPGDAIYKTSDKGLNERAAATYQGRPIRKVRATGCFTARAGEPPRFEARDNEGHAALAVGETPAEEAVTSPLTAEGVRAQLGKTGDTPFMFESIEADLDGRAAVRVSELNALRRAALERLEAQRAERNPERTDAAAHAVQPCARPQPTEAELSLFFWRWREGFADAMALADRVYVPHTSLGSAAKAAKQPGALMPWLPAVTLGTAHESVRRQAAEWKGMGAAGVLAGNCAYLELLKDAGLPVYADASLNAFNGWTLQALARLGFRGVALSHELTVGQIEALPDTGLEVEAAVYGRLPLMTSAYCPASGAGCNRDAKSCGLCAGGGAMALTDRIGARFPLLCDPAGCSSVLMNGDVLAVPGLARRLAAAGVSMLRIMVFDETPEEVEQIVRLFRQALHGEPVDGLKGRGFTKGHYFRGVTG